MTDEPSFEEMFKNTRRIGETRPGFLIPSAYQPWVTVKYLEEVDAIQSQRDLIDLDRSPRDRMIGALKAMGPSPEKLVDARHDTVHREVGNSRAAKVTRHE